MKPSFLKLALLLVSAALLSALGAGCQTTKGLGKDVENLGENMQDAAK